MTKRAPRKTPKPPPQVLALIRAKEILGGFAGLARAIGISPQAVHEMMRRGGQAPAEWCPHIDRATSELDQRVSLHELRPDLWTVDAEPPAIKIARKA